MNNRSIKVVHFTFESFQWIPFRTASNIILQKLEKEKIDCPKELLEKVKKKCKIQNFEDWKHVSKGFFRFYGAKQEFFKKYETLSSALNEIYPEECKKEFQEIPWKEIKELSKRPRIPGGYWNIKQTRIDFMNELVTKFQISKDCELNKISKCLIKEHGGRGLVDSFKVSELKELIANPPNPEKIANQINKIIKHYNLKGLRMLRRFHIVNYNPKLLSEFKNINNLIQFAFPDQSDDFEMWNKRLNDVTFDLTNTMDQILQYHRPDLSNSPVSP